MIRLWSPLVPAVLLMACASTAPPPGRFVPVHAVNFPDPFVLPHAGRFLAYATNAERFEANVQMAISTDLRRWEAVRRPDGRLHDAMPVLPRWAEAGWTWAPEVLPQGGRYLIYFTARERASGKQCTGVATADHPMGPFVSSAPGPLVCQRALGGSIDASPFRDSDGQLHLYWKSDANAVGKGTEIFVQKMTADGQALTGPIVALIRNDQPWEAHVIEAPTMVRHRGDYILFYSANHFGWEPHQRLSPYAMGYARCAGPMGPCVEAAENPILSSAMGGEVGCLSGPGHQSLFEKQGRSYIAFHAHAARAGCRNAGQGRHLFVAPLHWQDGRPVIGPGLRPSGSSAAEAEPNAQ